MNILIIGAGKMGLWISHQLKVDHTVALMDKDGAKLTREKGLTILRNRNEMAGFQPDLLINSVSLNATLPVFQKVLPLLPGHTILADMASVKNGLEPFYHQCGHRFVSTHPMFGPTFGNLNNLCNEHAIIIEESDDTGRRFFENLFAGLNLNIQLMSFQKHDQRMSGSLSMPFILSLLFANGMDQKNQPGTTFERHLQIAEGLLSEDDALLSEVLLNPFTQEKIKTLQKDLNLLENAIKDANAQELTGFIQQARANLLSDPQ